MVHFHMEVTGDINSLTGGQFLFAKSRLHQRSWDLETFGPFKLTSFDSIDFGTEVVTADVDFKVPMWALGIHKFQGIFLSKAVIDELGEDFEWESIPDSAVGLCLMGSGDVGIPYKEDVKFGL